MRPATPEEKPFIRSSSGGKVEVFLESEHQNKERMSKQYPNLFLLTL
jgi:hypothetical protein